MTRLMILHNESANNISSRLYNLESKSVPHAVTSTILMSHAKSMQVYLQRVIILCKHSAYLASQSVRQLHITQMH